MPFPLPKWLYYSDTASDKEKLTAIPTGRPDFDAFMQQNPEWWITEGEDKFYPKSLILCDVSILYLPWDIHELFKQLLEEGFKIYVWDKDVHGNSSLIPLHKDNLASLQHKEFSSSNKNDIINKLADMNISKDQTLLLSDLEIKKLRVEATKFLSDADLRVLDLDNTDHELLLEEDMSTWAEACEELSETKISGLAIIRDISSPFNSKIDLGETIRNNGINQTIECIECEHQIAHNALQSMSKKDINDNLSKAIKEIFYTSVYSPNLSCLSIYQEAALTRFSSDIELDDMINEARARGENSPLGHLISLKLGFRIQDVDFGILMETSNRLIDLSVDATNLSANHFIHENFRTSWKNIQHLELGIPNKEFLENALKYSTHLKKIILSGIKDGKIDSDFPELSNDTFPTLNGLEEIIITDYCVAEGVSLTALLKKVPHLKKLTLSNIESLSKFSNEIIPQIKMDNVEVLCFSGKIRHSVILEILKSCANVKQISLGESEFSLIKHCLTLIKRDEFKPYLSKLTPQSREAIRKAIQNEEETRRQEELKARLASERQKLKSELQAMGIQMPSASSFLLDTNKEATIAGSGYHKGSQKSDINTDPGDSPEKFNLDRIFYAKPGTRHPAPNHYRINVYPTLERLKGKFDLKSLPFELKEGPLNLTNCKQPTWEMDAGDLIKKRNAFNQEDRACLYGKYTLLPTTDWQPLPSFSPEEELTSIYIKGAKKNDIQIKYCTNQNLYFIKSNQPKEVHFNIQFSTEKYALPSKVQNLVNYYKNEFREEALKLDPHRLYTAEELLDEIHQQRVGACRHRSNAFKYWMEKNFPEYPVRSITNGCHQFVEIYHDNHWLKCDLGGYSADLNIHDEPEPLSSTTPEFEPHNDNLDVKENIKSVEKERENIDIDKIVKPKVKESEPPTQAQTLSHTEKPDHEKLKKQFITWEAKKKSALSLLEFNQKILQKENQNVLVKTSFNNTQVYQLALQQLCVNTQRPVFYVHSPRDLTCSANWIERHDDNTGTLKSGPGGNLHDFLMDHQNDSPVIIVNWNAFKADEIVKFNSLMDKIRLADGVTPVPEKAVVVGIYDDKAEDAYHGADFYSRFDKKYEYYSLLPNSRSLNESFPEIRMDEVAPDQADVIDLHQSLHWRTLLLGRWSMQGKQLIFVEGPLIKAVKEGRHVHLRNAPWENESFQSFWQQALLHRQITVAGESISFNNQVKFSRSEGIDWENLNKQIQWGFDESIKEVYTLNPTSFGQFFNTYEFKDDELFEEPGWLEQNKGKTIAINVSRALSAAQWSELLNAAQHYQVTLQIHPNKHLIIPPGMKPLSFSDEPILNSKVIVSNDIDYTLATLVSEKPAKIIDISELKSADLLLKQDATWGEDRISFHFNETVSEIYERLQTGERIILHGEFSQELLDSLAPVIIKNGVLPDKIRKSPGFGELILVSNKPAGMELINYESLQISNEDIMHLLEEKYSKDEISKLGDKIQTLSYVKLNTLINFIRNNPTASVEDCWLGLTHIPSKSPAHPISKMDLSIDVANEFENTRLAQVEHIFEYSPYVFVAGATGIGKSTFVHSTLNDTGKYKIYNEEKEISKWANDLSDKIKILFIDEANIGSSHYSKFEGLFDSPPWILINQQVVELTPKHKLIFAGNPLSYGGERHLPSLFERHANSVIFEAMPPSHLYHRVLKPVLEEHVDESTALEVSSIFLKTYQLLNQLSPNNILISPRELQMMAISVMAQMPLTPEAILKQSHYYAYEIAKGALPQDLQHKFENMFDQLFFTPFFESKIANKNTVGEFILTPSRFKAYTQLSDLLKIRNFQQTLANSEASRYGGLGGIILEGEPGTGKSLFVEQMLVEEGFKEAKLGSEPEDNHIFYRVPASMSQRDKEKLLIKAFHQGAIVLIDEINSMGMMEKLMNTLLMGRDPHGNRPMIPGFKLIGTQNPITYSGRKAKSTALERRLLKCQFSEYPLNELIDILHSKGLDLERAKALSNAFQEQRIYAIKNNLEPVPKFRDLSKAADRMLRRDRRFKLDSPKQLKKSTVSEQSKSLLFSHIKQKASHLPISKKDEAASEIKRKRMDNK